MNGERFSSNDDNVNNCEQKIISSSLNDTNGKIIIVNHHHQLQQCNNNVGLNNNFNNNINNKQSSSSYYIKNFVLPKFDSNLFDDDRVLSNLLKCEERYLPSNNYFSCVQTEINEDMRKTLTEWMLEVSDEELCDSEVFPLAVSYLDRFLSCEAVHKCQLQVLGCACLFLASKVKQPQPLQARRLVEFSANSISLSELMSWELLVLNRLKWDLATVTACDFLDHILYKLQLPPIIDQKLRPHLQFFVALIATEYQLAVLPPSAVAVGCLCVAFGRLLKDVGACGRMLSALRPILKADAYAYEPYVEAIYAFVESIAAGGRQTVCQGVNGVKLAGRTCESPVLQSTGTPTDIRDVEFP